MSMFEQYKGVTASRYFVLPPDQIDRFRAVVIPDDDVLPLDELPNCAPLATTDDGRVILHVQLGRVQIANIAGLSDVADPLGPEAIEALGITNSFVAQSRNGVLAQFPELDGTRTVEYTDPETGETATREEPLLPYHKWS